MRMSLAKTFFGKTAITAVAALMPFTFIAKASQDPFDAESLSAFRVKFLGGDNEELLFDVKYNNKERSNFRLLVLDETGEALYEDSYSKDLDKKLSVPRMTDSEHVTFVVKSIKENTEFSFRVKITTRVADDAIVMSGR
ncbi:MAG: hypothetical protein JNN00_12780 [Chitinophagaceae bacterium]|nr:hypothetical protein [Chitinophagaceae bacterium]